MKDRINENKKNPLAKIKTKTICRLIIMTDSIICNKNQLYNNIKTT